MYSFQSFYFIYYFFEQLIVNKCNSFNPVLLNLWVATQIWVVSTFPVGCGIVVSKKNEDFIEFQCCALAMKRQ